MSFVVFKINGKEHQVDGRFGPDVTLNEYIRNVADLRGTKAMCQEGGCGACVVAVRAATPPTNEMKTFAVNSVSAGYKLSETSTSETWLIVVTASAATPPSHKMFMNTFAGNFFHYKYWRLFHVNSNTYYKYGRKERLTKFMKHSSK